jgi:hypothetical protein
MKEIYLNSVPSQTLQVVLDEQNIQLAIYSKSGRLFVDININDVDVINCVIARNLVPLNCRNYLDNKGNFIFIDIIGDNDPVYTELGSRYFLLYITEEEYGRAFV